MTYLLGNAYDIKLPGSGILLKYTGKKSVMNGKISNRTSYVLLHSSMKEEYSVVKV